MVNSLDNPEINIINSQFEQNEASSGGSILI